MFLLVFHRALPDLQRMKLCYSVGTSPTPSSLDSRSSEFLTSGRCTLAPLCVRRLTQINANSRLQFKLLVSPVANSKVIP